MLSRRGRVKQPDQGEWGYEDPGVNADVKIPNNAEIEFPTLAPWSHLRHNGLVSLSAREWTTHAESGDPFHD
jgi:hypothetical protein